MIPWALPALAAVLAVPAMVSSEEIVNGISENPDSGFADESVEKDVRDLLTHTIFPTLSINGLTLKEAIDVIQSDAVRSYHGKVEANRQGLSFIIEGPVPPVMISFSGRDVSFGLALDEICRQSGMLWTNRGKIFLSPGKRFTKRKSPFPGEIHLPCLAVYRSILREIELS